MSGMGMEPGTVLDPVLLVRSANQSAQRPGVTMRDAMMATVAASAARRRTTPAHAEPHETESRRHFVSNGKAQAGRTLRRSRWQRQRDGDVAAQISGRASSTRGKEEERTREPVEDAQQDGSPEPHEDRPGQGSQRAQGHEERGEYR